jgi:hypothetical protein
MTDGIVATGHRCEACMFFFKAPTGLVRGLGFCVDKLEFVMHNYACEKWEVLDHVPVQRYEGENPLEPGTYIEGWFWKITN